jgi:hypothetical protein
MATNFWTDTTLEPKRQYKFLMSIAGGAGAGKLGIPAFVVKKTAKPSFETATVEHSFLNHTFYYPGRTKWQPIDVTVVDVMSTDASLNMSKAVLATLEASGYKIPTMPTGGTTIGLGTASKSLAANSLGKISITTIDAAGNTIEVWTLFNPWITKATFGDLDYMSEELTEVNFTIQYDFANLKVGGDDVLSNARA